MPRSLSNNRVELPFSSLWATLIGTDEPVQLATVIGTASSFAVGLLWYLHRRDPWAWIVQDSLSVGICVIFVRTLRLPSLRVAAFFLGLMFFYDIFMVFVSPLFFHGTSVMVAVATAGRSKSSINEIDGTCERTLAEQIPMLMQVPHLGAFTEDPVAELVRSLPDGLYPLPPSAVEGNDNMARGFAWRLSGAPGAAGLIGLGDIVLPALALAYARRLDICLSAASSPSVRSDRGRAPPRDSSGDNGGCGYFVWAGVGYALGLAVTHAANIYGWTFNGVQGQPALLYLVPGVIGSQLVRASLHGELHAVWTGAPLPQPHENISPLGCDGCRRRLLLDEICFSNASANRDFCARCYTNLPEEKRANLSEMMVYQRCGMPAPAANGELL